MSQLDTEQRRALIDRIAQLPASLESVVRDLSPAELTTHHLPGEWSVAQNVHHVADSHMNSFIRCKLIATEDHPTLRPYDQDRWAALPDTDNPAIALSLQLLRGLHARWVIFFESLSDADWVRAGLHPDIGIVTLEDQLRSYAAHGEGHIDQIQRTLAAKS